MNPKYKVGDILVYNCEADGSQETLIVDKISKDEFGRCIYHHYYSETLGAFIYEEDVIGIMGKDNEKYKRYQLYLELKKEFG